MPNYKLLIQYDGTRLKGWQVQGNTEETVQGIIESRISEIVGCAVEIQGSGRTDAGVHAVGQVANVHLKEPIEELFSGKSCKENAVPISQDITEQPAALKSFLYLLNDKLPADIAVTQIEQVDERFHARYSAISKTYRYVIRISPVSDVFRRKYIYSYTDKKLNLEDMKKAAAYMLGKHDFKAFCGNRKMKKSTVRTVESIQFDVSPDNSEIAITYKGDGFLQNMIRIMTGTLLEVGSGKRRADSIPFVLESLDRDNAGFTAPACGLTLIKVEYEE